MFFSRWVCVFLIVMASLAQAEDSDRGALEIEAAATGQVRVDGAIVGRAPVRIADLTPGVHSVRIDFDDGGRMQERLYVQTGKTARYRFAAPPLQTAARYRQGWNMVLGIGPFAHVTEDDAGAGVQAAFGVNRGLSPKLDVRIMAVAGAGAFDVGGSHGNEAGFELGARSSLRVNLGSTYSMEFGVRLGIYHESYAANDYLRPDARKRLTTFEIAPEISLLSFRMGELRQFELTLWQAAPIIVDAPHGPFGFQTGLSLSYLFLDD